MNGQPAKRSWSRRDADEAQLVGLAILRLRRESGITLRQLAVQVGCTSTTLTQYEQGSRQPSAHTLQRIVAAMGCTLTDPYRAQQTTAGHGGPPEDGTLPPDTRMPRARTQKDTLRLAQECGKAVAHCCLAFMELQSGSWRARGAGATIAAAAVPALEVE